MSVLLVCPNGHEWDASPPEHEPAAGSGPVCPVCGAVAEAYPTQELLGALAAASAEMPPPPKPVPTVVAAVAAGMLAAPDGGPVPAIAGYEILGRLGHGGMGVVYKARQVKLNRLVALKMILAGAQAKPEELTRFHTEAEAVARLQHPNIVQIHEVGELDGCPYLALEFVDRGSLAQALAGTPQPARAAAQLVVIVARAVHYAHQRGIVHRDLKPANILLQSLSTKDTKEHEEDRTGPEPLRASSCPSWTNLTPKITDFGLAKRLEVDGGPTKTGDILGTPSYMAPEQAAGKAAGPLADVYGLGATLYEMLTGRPPFRGETPLETLRQVEHEEPVPPSRLQPKVPRDLGMICLKCLQKEPPKRYPTAGGLADDLRRFLAGEPIQARPTSAWERGRKWAQRRPTAATLAAVSVLTLLGFVAAGWAVALRERQHAREVERERDEATQQRDRAEQQRQRAEANFRLAREAVNRSYTTVSQQTLLNVPRLKPLRQELLQTALEFYQEFVKQRSEDPEVQADLGRAFARLGGITAQIGSQPQAVAFVQQAAAIFESLARDHPEVPDHRVELALCYNDLVTLYRTTGQSDQAEAAGRKGLAIAEELVRAHPEVPRYQLDLAANWNDLGVFYRKIGKPDQAEAAYRQALALHDKLHCDYPDDLNYQHDLAMSYRNQGNQYRAAGKWDQAESAYDKALALAEKLASDRPWRAKYRALQAGCYACLGLLHRATRRWDQAEASYHKARALLEQLTREHPQVTDYQHDLAECHNGLGNLYSSTGRKDQAQTNFQKALVLLENLTGDHPERVDVACTLGGAQCNLGNLLGNNGQFQLALDRYGQAIRTLTALLQQDERHAKAKEFLRNSYHGRAETLTRSARPQEALPDWERALQLDEGRNPDPLRRGRAVTLAQLGDHTRATAEVKTPADKRRLAAGALYTSARVFAVSSAAVLKDDKLSSEQRDKLAEQYAARAVELLAGAHAKDLSRASTLLPALKSNSDFNPLRSREDFRKLLSRLEGRGDSAPE